MSHTRTPKPYLTRESRKIEGTAQTLDRPTAGTALLEILGRVREFVANPLPDTMAGAAIEAAEIAALSLEAQAAHPFPEAAPLVPAVCAAQERLANEGPTEAAVAGAFRAASATIGAWVNGVKELTGDHAHTIH